MSDLPFANKSLGQHWLTDVSALEAMVIAAGIEAGDVVLEVGPGPGALTELLVEVAERVVAVEFDELLARQLPRRVTAANLEVYQQDILQFDLTQLPPNYKVCANIPYYLTSKLLRTLSESSNPPSVVALLVQKEVAQRIAASPGDMSLLSVSVQWYFESELCEVVPAQSFVPPPKVDSQIIQLVRRQKPLFADVDTKVFFQLVKAGYSARRKTLHNSLSGGLRINKDAAAAMLTAAEVSLAKRPQELSLADWHRLYLAYQENTPTPSA
jgi:16S rRNA (adenine1518-N6/adenine1519-N6)-dimethyltransferase